MFIKNKYNKSKEIWKINIIDKFDIRTNKIGKKYVQYRYINDPLNTTYNNDIDTFIVMREKIAN